MSRYPMLTVATAVVIYAFASMQQTAMSARPEAAVGAGRTASVATLTTRDFRVAVMARRMDGGGLPTAEVRVDLARREGGSWRELGGRRLDETFFWSTVTGPRAVCRLAIDSAGSGTSFRPSVTVRLLLSPSLGCGRTHRIPLPGRS